MKKLFTYTSLLLVTLITVFGFKLNASAACDGMDYNTCRTGSIHGDIVVGGDGDGLYASGVSTINKSSEDYYYTSIGVTAYFNRSGNFIYSGYIDANATYRLYCLDAQYVGTNPLYASRFLLNTDSDITIQALDTALLSILTGNGGTGTLVSSTRGADYWARLLAMRAVVAVFGVHNAASGTYNSAYYAGLTAVNSFLSHSDTAVAYNELTSALAALGKSLTPTTSFSAHTNYYFSGTPVNTAEAYFVAALSDAAEYVRNYTDGANVDTTSVLPMPTDVEATEDSVGTMVEKDVTHTIIVSDLPNNGTNTFTIDGITMDHEYTGLDYYVKSIKIGDDYYETTNGGQDLAQLFGVNLLGGGSDWDFTDETIIEITVHFEGFVDSDYYEELECGDAEINYSITGTSSTQIQNKYSNYVATIWYSGTSKKQRYLGIEELSGGQASSGISQWASPYSTYLIDACDCTDLIDACIESGNINSTECQELFAADCGECNELEVECALGDDDACDQFAAVCEVECGTTVSNFDCCDAQNQLIISTLDNHEVSVLGPEDVKLCFVDQIDNQADSNGDAGANGVAGAKDDVGNSYTLMGDNKYCAVSCKEDYIMSMPTAKLVNAGRYFTFSAAVDGTKTCYTNTIDREHYNEDMANIQVQILDKYNEYLNWKTALETDRSGNYLNIYNSWNQYSGWDCCDALTGECFACDEEGYYVSGTYERVTYDVDYDTGIVEIDRRTTSTTIGLYDEYTSDGELQYGSVEGHGTGMFGYGRYGKDHDGGSDSDSCSDGCSAEPGDEDTLVTHLTSLMNTAYGELEDLMEERDRIIAEYDECTSWTTEINYSTDEPEVYYEYEEDYYADLINNYGNMDATITSSSDAEWYCNISGATSSIRYPDINNSYDNCTLSSTSSNQDSSLNYVYCNEDGCGTEAFQVSDARYKKITSSVEARYVPSTLFYNVYPSGEIVNADEGENRDDAVALENSLPVSLATERGIYKYTVNIGGLGEFYNQAPTDNLGRLIANDRRDNAVINRDDYTNYVNDNGYVEYACSYLVNMGITDDNYLIDNVIICDFDTECTGDDCYSDCVGPNCYGDDNTCHGDDCVADCIGAGCIYDSDAGTSLLERVVSLSNLFPNGTDSYNWNRNLNAKAAETIDEIEDAGNSVYDAEPILSVTITPSAAREIKAYNDDVEDEGGYSNATVYCEALNGYEEIACYSSFIDYLIDGSYGDVVNDNSYISNENNRDASNYFELWDGTISEDLMLGPSWK